MVSGKIYTLNLLLILLPAIAWTVFTGGGSNCSFLLLFCRIHHYFLFILPVFTYVCVVNKSAYRYSLMLIIDSLAADGKKVTFYLQTAITIKQAIK